MAAWVLVGQTIFHVTESDDEVVTLPGTLAEGDVVVVAWVSDTDSNRAGPPIESGYQSLFDSASDPGSSAYYKQMGASPDSVVTIAEGGEETGSAGVLQVWRGADLSTPLDIAVVTATAGTGMPDPPSATTATAGARRIIIGFLDDDDIAASVTAPSGFGDLLANQAHCTIMIASREEEAPGALNPDAFGGPGTDAWVAIHFALRPGAGAASEADATLTEAADTISAAGSLTNRADATLTEAADTITEGNTATLREAADTITATGSLRINATATLTEAADTIEASSQRPPAFNAQAVRDIGFPQEACDEDIALVVIQHDSLPDEGHLAMPGGFLYLTDGVGEFDDELNCYTLTVAGRPYICGPIDIVEPGESEDDPRGKLIIPNVDPRIGKAIEAIHTRPTVSVSIVLGSDPYSILGGPYEDLELYNVDGDAIGVEGDLSWPLLRNEPWPKDTVRPSKYRAAFRALA